MNNLHQVIRIMESNIHRNIVKSGWPHWHFQPCSVYLSNNNAFLIVHADMKCNSLNVVEVVVSYIEVIL